jgi:hypothetical protein
MKENNLWMSTQEPLNEILCVDYATEDDFSFTTFNCLQLVSIQIMVIMVNITSILNMLSEWIMVMIITIVTNKANQ